LVEHILIPASTALVVITAMGLALMSNLVTKKMVDVKREKRIHAEVQR